MGDIPVMGAHAYMKLGLIVRVSGFRVRVGVCVCVCVCACVRPVRGCQACVQEQPGTSRTSRVPVNASSFVLVLLMNKEMTQNHIAPFAPACSAC